VHTGTAGLFKRARGDAREVRHDLRRDGTFLRGRRAALGQEPGSDESGEYEDHPAGGQPHQPPLAVSLLLPQPPLASARCCARLSWRVGEPEAGPR
jgi:hypothetical protein